jgi:hypothetical protein
VKAATVLLAVRGHMSVVRAAQMMHALLDAEVSSGFTSSLVRRLARALEPFMGELKARLRAAPVLHLDETAAQVSGDEMRQLESQALLRGEILDPDRRQPGPERSAQSSSRHTPVGSKVGDRGRGGLVQSGMAASTRAAATVRAAVSALGSRSIQALIPAPS